MKENSNKWEMRRETEMERIRWEEKKQNWEKMTDTEKIEKIKNEEPINTGKSREDKIKRAKEGRKRWKEWREKEAMEGEGDEKEEAETEEDSSQNMGGVP